ncbi:MAG: M6 family metalloprotease domain-containing protein [Alloprevotella sp.]|nr:M6 family metalloprotease domain-containing protein [Alloprevotella sp.]
MKKICGLFLFVLLAVQSLAIPPRRAAYPVVQSDGTTLMVMKYGDGHLAFYATLDGLTLQRNEAGDLCYARLENGRAVSTGRIAHEASLRSAEEKEFVRAGVLRVQDAAAQRMTLRRAAPNRAISASTTDGLGSYGKSGAGAVNSIGNYTIPVLMVQFKDVKFKSTTTAAKMTRFYNTEGYREESKCVGSVRDYFKSQSNGLFVPTFEIVGTVTMPQNVSYYGGNVTDRSSYWYGYDKGLCDDNYFVVDAVQLAQSQGVDFSKYAVNGNVPLISILYAGYGEATGSMTSQEENTIWPCEYDIDQSIGGVHFNSFFVGNELYYDGTLMGMGTFCHEFGHALGLPDFYVTDYSYTDTEPVGEWSIMDMGSYVQDARAPMGYTAYERSYLGWLDIPELTTAEPVTLDSYDDFAAGTGTPARLLRNPSNNKEYFIFENHQPGTWYPSSYGSGMLVMRIAYDKNAWEENTLNNTKSRQRIKLITANGSNPSPDGSSARELFSYNGTAVDVASWSLYNGSKLEKPFYQITNKNGKITFNFLEQTFNKKEIGDTIRRDSLVFVVQSETDVFLVAKESGHYKEIVNVPEAVMEDNQTFRVVGIAEGAFADCTELTGVTLPKTIDYIAENAFTGATALEWIVVDEKNRTYRVDGGALEEKIPTEEPTSAAKAVSTKSEERVLFDFAANPWGLPVSSTSSASAGTLTQPLTVDNVVMTAQSGSTPTRMWKGTSSTDLRVYKSGGALTFTTTDGALITAINVTASKWDMTADAGTLDGKTWTGEEPSVTFTAQGTCTISQIELTVANATEENASWRVILYPAAGEDSCALDTNVVEIYQHAFEDTRLAAITLPASLCSLGVGALSTPTLQRITALGATPAECLGDPFAKVDKKTCVLEVPAGSEELYQAAPYWRDFILPTGISAIIQSGNSPSGHCYDLQGRKLSNGKLSNGRMKGVYIQNGKKVVR